MKENGQVINVLDKGNKLGQMEHIMREHGLKIKFIFFIFTHNQAEGNGKFYHADHDFYIGEWLDNKAHGYGEY